VWNRTRLLDVRTYHFHFDLIRQASLEERIEGANLPQDLCVGLFGPAGKAVQVLRTNRHIGDIVQVAEGGRFSINGAPVGEFQVRVGPESLLRSGRSLHEQTVKIVVGENPRLSIRLP
jgi:hypothetical protein